MSGKQGEWCRVGMDGNNYELQIKIIREQAALVKPGDLSIL